MDNVLRFHYLVAIGGVGNDFLKAYITIDSTILNHP
jgi:hypothetical protein